MKTCTKCGETKPLTEFHRKNSHGNMGYHPSCKACKNAQNLRMSRLRVGKKIVVKEFVFDTELTGFIVHARSQIPYDEIQAIRNAGGFAHHFPEVTCGVQP